jgi:hypothetical protein
MDILRFIPGYTDHIYAEGKEPLFVMLVAFLIAFLLTRGYTRAARKRGWGSGNVGGVHLHHMVPGIILVLIGGLVSFTRYADNEIVWTIAAIIFGVGAALVLDEFALIFHLKDVYWSREGRSSVDATIIAVMVAGLLLVSSSPFEADNDPDVNDPRSVAFTIIAVSLLFAVVTFLKGKYFLGTLAIFFLPAGIVGSWRLGKPWSAWAHVFYSPDRGRHDFTKRHRQKKLDRAWKRYETSRLGRFENWFVDLIGGTPHMPPAYADEAQPSVSPPSATNA